MTMPSLCRATMLFSLSIVLSSSCFAETFVAGSATTEPSPTRIPNAPTLRLQEKLDAPITADFDNVPLSKALDAIRDRASINLFVDWKSIEAGPVNRNTPVTLILRDPVQTSTVITLLLRAADANLQSAIDDGVLVITTIEPPKPAVITRAYYIRDLTPGGPRQQEGDPDPIEVEQHNLAILIMETVECDKWRDNGGTIGVLCYINGKFIVKATETMHQQIEALLAQVRNKSEK